MGAETGIRDATILEIARAMAFAVLRAVLHRELVVAMTTALPADTIAIDRAHRAPPATDVIESAWPPPGACIHEVSAATITRRQRTSIVRAVAW